jgi:hypothetical protein
VADGIDRTVVREERRDGVDVPLALPALDGARGRRRTVVVEDGELEAAGAGVDDQEPLGAGSSSGPAPPVAGPTLPDQAQSRISGRSMPWVRTYWRCSMSRSVSASRA